MQVEPLRLLIAVDETDHALRVAEVALKLAKLGEIQAWVLSVVAEPSALAADPEVEPEMVKLEREGIEEIHRRIRTTLDQAKSLKLEFLVRGGVPAKVICEEAATRSVDFILMGSRSLGRMQRALLGSVSQEVIRESHTPVIVVGKF